MIRTIRCTPLTADPHAVPTRRSSDLVLSAIRDADREQYSISEEDGRFLRVLVGARGARRVLEIGAARGYSAIWMGRSEEHTSELQSPCNLVCRLLHEKK